MLDTLHQNQTNAWIRTDWQTGLKLIIPMDVNDDASLPEKNTNMCNIMFILFIH